MKTKQLAALVVIQIGFNAGGGAVGALLPVFAGRLGADSSAAGFLFALVFAGMATGILFSGWLSNRWQQRKAILITAGVLGSVPMLLSGQSQTLTQLSIASFMVTFFLGIVIAMSNTLAGLSAGPTERGRVFGILGSTFGVGFVIGGLVSGPVVDRWGYEGLFDVAAFICFSQALAGLFLENKIIPKAAPSERKGRRRGAVFSSAFLLLIAGTIITFAVNGMQGLARSLVMDQRHFLAADITSTVTVSGLISIPFPFTIGWLSDRIGRKPLIIAGYLATALSVFTLIGATALWHFWVSTALSALTGASFGVGLALVADLVPLAEIGTSIALYGATNWIGLIFGSALTGFAFDNLGLSASLLAGTLIGLLGVVLIFLIRRPVIVAAQAAVAETT